MSLFPSPPSHSPRPFLGGARGEATLPGPGVSPETLFFLPSVLHPAKCSYEVTLTVKPVLPERMPKNVRLNAFIPQDHVYVLQ
jgi:hypothetical protein